MMSATGHTLRAAALCAGALLAGALWGGAAAWAQAPAAAAADVAAPAVVTFSEADHLSFAQATQALKAGNLDAAEAALRQLQSRLPYRPEIVNNLGLIAQLRGDLGQATTLFLAASKIEPHYLSVFSNAQRLASGARVSDAPFLMVESLPGAAASPPVLATDLAATRAAPRQSAALATLSRLNATKAEAAAVLELAPLPAEAPLPAAVVSLPVAKPANAAQDLVADAAPAVPALALPQAIEQWRQAWQNQDINAYLAWYASDFVPTPATSKSAWEAKRRSVFAAPKTGVSLSLNNLSTQTGQAGELVTFDQTYTASNHTDQGRKTMQWKLLDGQWRIVSEGFVATAKP